MAQSYVRLYLVPQGNTQPVIDVPLGNLVLSGGQFQHAQTAPTITLVEPSTSSQFQTGTEPSSLAALVTSQQQEVRICWREVVAQQTNPDTGVIEVPDPSGGNCVCGVTCLGPDLAYVQVQNIIS